MGLMDNLRNFFSGSRNTQVAEVQKNVEYEKSILAENIVDLVTNIKRLNSFDSSVWNLSNISSYQLKSKSLDELQKLNSSLEKRLSELNKKSTRIDPKREQLEASKWLGQKPEHMSNLDFDRFQRSDDSR